MSRALQVVQAGPAMSVQDLGRPGSLSEGLSRGGAMDRLALYEGAALLGQEPGCAALEMAAMGGRFRARGDLRIALTGAPMRAAIDGTPVAWNASHALPDGSELEIGAAEAGVYGYLHLGGGIATDPLMGARSAHLTAGIGGLVAAGTDLALGEDGGGPVDRMLDVAPRCGGGVLRVVDGPQTHRFGPDTIERFTETAFRRDARGNRQGVRLAHKGAGFAPEGARSILSDVVVPGDIQVTGDGSPYVLMAECQTTGGYPRIGTVLPCDLPLVAQAAPGDVLRFRFVSAEEGLAVERAARRALSDMPRAVRARLRDPAELGDLLGHQLISGVTAGRHEEEGP